MPRSPQVEAQAQFERPTPAQRAAWKRGDWLYWQVLEDMAVLAQVRTRAADTLWLMVMNPSTRRAEGPPEPVGISEILGTAGLYASPELVYSRGAWRCLPKPKPPPGPP